MRCAGSTLCDTLGGNSYTLPGDRSGRHQLCRSGRPDHRWPDDRRELHHLAQSGPDHGAIQQCAASETSPLRCSKRAIAIRFNGVASFEYRPTDDLQFYVDVIGGLTDNNMNRSDNTLGIRAGAASVPMIPVGLKIDSNSFITSGTILGGIYGTEARPYVEHGNFYSINPGMSWQVTDLLHVDFQLNASRSNFFRDAPTFYVVTAAVVAECHHSGPDAARRRPGHDLPDGGSLPDNDVDQYRHQQSGQLSSGTTAWSRLQDEKHITKTAGRASGSEIWRRRVCA